MPSNRTGIEAGSVNITGTTNINQNQTTTNNYGTTKTDTIVGYYPETFRSEVPIEHRKDTDIGKTLEDLKARISNAEAISDRQPLLVIKGPVNTGKSTAAHFLMADETLDFDNRIRINAQTKKSIEHDLRELHKEMRVLQNPDFRPQPHNDQEDMKLLLKWLYRNLLSNRTLLIFDNVAVLDLDLNWSPFRDVYELVPYLPLRTSLIAGKMVAPTIVITTRAVMNTESALFSVILLNPPKNSVFPTNIPFIQEKLGNDLDLIAKVENGKLAAFFFVAISFALPEQVFVDLLIHLCCHCPQVQDLLELKNGVTKIQVENVLMILQYFSLVARFAYSVRLPQTVKFIFTNGFTAPKIFNEQELMKTLIYGVSEVVRVPVFDKNSREFEKPVQKWWLTVQNVEKLYDADLAIIELCTRNLYALIHNLYPYMLKYQVPTSVAFYTFGFQGNCYELQLQRISRVLQYSEFANCLPGSFTAELEINLRNELAWTAAVVQGYPSASSATNFNSAAVELSEALLGDLPGGPELKSSKWINLSFSLHRMESLLRLGKHDQVKALDTSIAGDTESLNFCFRYTYLFSALPPASIHASLLTSQGEYLQAQHFLKTALDLSRAENGLHNYTTADLEHSLAKIEAYNGNFKEALKLTEHAIAILHQFLGVTTVRYIKAVATKAKILTLRSDYQEASKSLTNARSQFDAQYHQDHPHCLILRYYLAKTLFFQGCYFEALREVDAVLKAMGEGHFSSHNHYRLKCNLIRTRALQKTSNFAKSILKQLKKTASTIYDGEGNPKAMKLDLLFAKSFLPIDNYMKSKSVADSVLASTKKGFVKLRLKAIGVLLDVSRNSNEEQFDVQRKRALLLGASEAVDEVSKSAGPYHYLTLKYKLVLAETLLMSHNMHLFEVEQQVKAVLNFLDSSEYPRNNVLVLEWRHLEVLLLIDQKQFIDAKAKLDILISLVQPDSHFRATLLYSSAILETELGLLHELSTQKEDESLPEKQSTDARALMDVMSAFSRLLLPESGLAAACSSVIIEAESRHLQKAYNSMTDLFHQRTNSKVKFSEPNLGEMNAFLAFLVLKIKGPGGSGEAIICCHNGVAAMESTFGADHHKTVQAKVNLAVAYIAGGNKSIAVDLLLRIMITSRLRNYKANQIEPLMELFNPADVIKKLKYKRGGEIYVQQ